jgi:hypothetical protein
VANYLSGSRHQLLFALRPTITKLTSLWLLPQEKGLRLPFSFMVVFYEHGNYLVNSHRGRPRTLRVGFAQDGGSSVGGFRPWWCLAVIATVP